jgi:hypothetical protein
MQPPSALAPVAESNRDQAACNREQPAQECCDNRSHNDECAAPS